MILLLESFNNEGLLAQPLVVLSSKMNLGAQNFGRSPACGMVVSRVFRKNSLFQHQIW